MSSQEPGWIAVVGWNEMTHRDTTRGKNSALSWHRAYARVLDDEGYWSLPAGARGIYHGLVLAALRNPGEILGTTPNSTLWLTRKIGVKVSRRTLDLLNHAGLVALCASKVQAERLHAASPRDMRDRDRDRDSSKDVRSSSNVGERPKDAKTDNGSRLDELLPTPDPHVTALSAARARIGKEIG